MAKGRWQVAAIAAIAVVVLVGVVGYFAIPIAARWGLETVGSRELGRTVRVASISANPYTLRLTVKGLTVEGLPGEPAPLLTVQQATVNASISSVLRFAPVIDGVKIDGLTANIVRLEPQRFNFDDIIERLRAKPKKDDDKPAGFTVGNIEVAGSLVNFDDRVAGRKHALSDIAIGIPFISNLPVDVEVKVLPSFSAKLNGSPIAVAGETTPFHQTLESSINVKLDGLDIPTYLAYSPVRLNFTVPRGSLDTDLRIAFRRAVPASGDKPAQAAQTLISGPLVVNGFVLAAPAANAQPLIGWKSLRVVLDEVDPFARRAVVGDIALVAPTIELIRDVSGAVNWVLFGKQPLLETPKPAAASSKPADSATARSPQPFAFTLKHAAVNQGTVNYLDDSAGSFQAQVVNLAAEASDLTTTSNARGKARVTGDIADGHGSLKLEGEVGLAPVGGRLALEARDVRLRAAARYLAHVVNATLDGQSDVIAVVEFAAADPAMKIAVREIAVRSKDVQLRGPAGSGANFDLAGMTIDGAELDLNARQITIAKLSLDGPRAMVRRLPDGRINWLTVFRAKPGKTTSTTEKQEGAAAAQPWSVILKEAAIARGDLQLEDMAVDPNVKLRMSAITGTVSNVVSDGSQRAELALRTRFGSGGTIAVNGGARWKPLATDLRVDARSLDIAAVRPYLAERLNAVLASALLSARGNVAVNQASAGAPLKVAYKGSGRLANLHMLDARSENDLLKWQVLDLEQINAKIGEPPPEVTVGKVSLADFYARIIVSDQGRLNLADLIKREGQPATEPAPKPGSKPPAKPSATTKPAEVSTPVDRELAGNEPAQAAQSRTATTTVAKPAADPSAPRPVIRIGQIEVARGNVNFTDNFIKPNYTANMTGLGGTVTTLASDATEPATIALAGMIDDDAPVNIDGRLNPLAPTLFLDIEGRTKGVDLPRLTPYSLKYAGYPILKGKLSMEVKYKVEDQKLTANNHLFLDQLTFGEKVDSPTATKLPVLLAVSLLKNTRGEIDINLPVSGTLDDPKFSVGGIIIQVIINVLTKIVTAPFAALASAFGGGEELGYVEFPAGSVTLSAEQTKRIDTLAKALSDRPALKLDIIGRVDPSVDTEGARKAKLDAKLRAAKVQQVVRGGGESVDPAKVTITEQERPALIAAVYAEEKIPDKPRNVIGIAKTVPAPEMETLIVTNTAVTPEDLRALANQRATVVRNRLETEGKVPRERLFLVEPKLTTEGIKDQGAKTRVDFSLK
jgi:uncharacterized protein involved in outer membrane biogenesis